MLDGTILRHTLQAILPAAVIEHEARALGVVERPRKLDVTALVRALVLSEGCEDSGRLADAFRRYQADETDPVVRGAFYGWMDAETADLLESLLDRAMAYTATRPTHLPGVLAGVDDWIIVDSETVTLRDALKESLPASGSPAGIKVHKEYSVGRGCMVGVHFSCARDHDSRHLDVNERFRGKGLLVDLGYASLARLRQCDEHATKYVLRLKDDWKPRIERLVRGEVTEEILPGTDFDAALLADVLLLQGQSIDADVVLGGTKASTVRCRLVAVPTAPDGRTYRSYLTNLPRNTHGPHQVAQLYRVRYEIELDNKLDKSTARLDQIRATTVSSVKILLCAALLHSLLAGLLVHEHLLKRVAEKSARTPPLHPILVAHALRTNHTQLLDALSLPGTRQATWDALANIIVRHGHDPNWRRRPSVLDQIRGLTAPEGRPRRRRLRQCPPQAAPFRGNLAPKMAIK